MTTSEAHLQIKPQPGDGGTILQLSGVIDEKFEAGRLLGELQPITVLDVSGIKRITSFGVRQWTEAMKGVPGHVKHLYLFSCPAIFVDQLNMVLNFAGRGEVISAQALYVCDKCDHEESILLDIYGDRAQLQAGQMPAKACPSCGAAMQLADDPQAVVRLVNSFGAKSIDPVAAALLRKAGLYTAKEVGRAAEATKLIHGDVTLFQLVGVLDSRFRARRLASGVEGDVVFDLGEVEGMDSAGVERFNELLTQLSGASTLTLVDLPEVMVKALIDGKLKAAQALIYSMRARFKCTNCGAEDTIPLLTSENVRQAGRVCKQCGRPMGLLSDAAIFEKAAAPHGARIGNVPPLVAETIAQRHELLSRARAESSVAPASSSSDSLSRYRVIKPLTEGGMAEIFLAVHQGIAGFEKLIVLKKIRRKMLEQRQVAVTLFLNEAKIAANLNHPNIVQVFEVGEHGGDLFIAMEYIHGVDTRHMIRKSIVSQAPLAVEHVLFIGSHVAAGLHHAHTARDLSGRTLNIVHRDVSPSNIVIGFDGQVKLLDFGVATAAVGESVGGLIGKFSYMSPEQVLRQPLDGRSDVFALGVVLYEMLVLKPLFRRNTDQATLQAVIKGDLPQMPDSIPPFVQDVVKKALAKDRDQRYSDARALQFALEDALRRLGSTVTSQQMAELVQQMFPDRSATPPVDPAMYRLQGSSPSPSQSYKLSSQPSGQWDESPTQANTSSPVTAPTAIESKDATPVKPAPQPAEAQPIVRRNTFDQLMTLGGPQVAPSGSTPTPSGNATPMPSPAAAAPQAEPVTAPATPATLKDPPKASTRSEAGSAPAILQSSIVKATNEAVPATTQSDAGAAAAGGTSSAAAEKGGGGMVRNIVIAVLVAVVFAAVLFAIL